MMFFTIAISKNAFSPVPPNSSMMMSVISASFFSTNACAFSNIARFSYAFTPAQIFCAAAADLYASSKSARFPSLNSQIVF